MSQATITLLFLLFAVIMFVWEKIPLGLTSMIVCVGLLCFSGNWFENLSDRKEMGIPCSRILQLCYQQDADIDL